MSKERKPQWSAHDLPLALYLNQRLTFDVIATLEKGLSSFSTVQTTSTEGSKGEKSGGIGISNAFAFLGVGRRSSQNTEETESSTTEIIHTPASLFARLRQDLRDQDIVHTIEGATASLDELCPGCFVEFESALRRSSLEEFLTVFVEAHKTMSIFNTNIRIPNKGQSRRKSVSPQTTEIQQAEAILSAVASEDFQVLIAKVGKIQIILSTETKHYVDYSTKDIIDGTFRVFGKITRRISQDSPETISLFSKTYLAKIPGFEGMVNSLKTVKGFNFSGPIESAIAGPALQIIPIAIFA